jgi:hypothetical protein
MRQEQAPLSEFVSFPKIARSSEGVVITEKIDGTNAQVSIDVDGTIRVGSRNRWITPEKDNFGFARFIAEQDPDEVRKLGVGRHYGEWYGAGVQIGYGLSEKRFALFNTHLWRDGRKPRPSFACVVPILYEGEHNADVVEAAMIRLRDEGSVAVPGWREPEGVVVFNYATGTYKKVTFREPKWAALAAGGVA